MTLHIFDHPTHVDPDAIDNIHGLRQALRQANQHMTRYAAALAERDQVGRDFLGLINRVLLQHIVGDFRGVAAILEAQLDASPRLRQSLEEVLEGRECRQLQEWMETVRSESGQEEVPPYNAGAHDPWAMKTVEELRNAVDVMNRAGIQISTQLTTLEGVLKSLTAEVSVIVVNHIKGDHAALSRAVASFCERHVTVKNGDKSKVH
ncbi:hypothetical protein BLA9940_02597 [Burkholderia aenigmatica]|uniref:hypothetical protein n=1 Tax=Burkholderia cepacia complex TaxID=87882 RepID=UPI000F07ED2B|nr:MULTISPECIES: hypothetical protein [Burkholderia cepacia complex]AYQ37082.1 hypothetical protein CVS37_02390 [Burkholderia lata]VWC57445.1 hypothetical protein BLA9940_02597 [Burkholderia aenigmatica]